MLGVKNVLSTNDTFSIPHSLTKINPFQKNIFQIGNRLPICPIKNKGGKMRKLFAKLIKVNKYHDIAKKRERINKS